MRRNGVASSLPFWITRMAPVFSTTNSRWMSPGGAVTPRGCDRFFATRRSLTVGTVTACSLWLGVRRIGFCAAARLPALAETSTRAATAPPAARQIAAQASNPRNLIVYLEVAGRMLATCPATARRKPLRSRGGARRKSPSRLRNKAAVREAQSPSGPAGTEERPDATPREPQSGACGADLWPFTSG